MTPPCLTQIFMSASSPALSRHFLDLAMVSPLMQGLLVQVLQPVQPDQLMVVVVTDRDLRSEEEEDEVEDGQAGLVVALPQLI